MRSQSAAFSWAVMLSAVTSLVLMICLFQIDIMVRGALYDYGLQFSYDWATSYLRLTQIGFVAGWINIVVAFAVQLHNITMKRKAEPHLAAVEKACTAGKMQEAKKAHGEGSEEHKDSEPKSSDEAPAMAPGSEAQEKKEEPQQPEQAPEQEPQQSETEPEKKPSLLELFQ